MRFKFKERTGDIGDQAVSIVVRPRPSPFSGSSLSCKVLSELPPPASVRGHSFLSTCLKLPHCSGGEWQCAVGGLCTPAVPSDRESPCLGTKLLLLSLELTSHSCVQMFSPSGDRCVSCHKGTARPFSLCL